VDSVFSSRFGDRVILRSSTVNLKSMRLKNFQQPLPNHVPFYWIPQLVIKILFLPGIMIQPVSAQNLDQNVLCKRSLLNAQCQFYQGSKQELSASQDPIQPQVIKFKLNDLSGVSEWIRVEVKDREVKLLHTVVTQSGLSKGVSRLMFLPIGVNHTWYDHVTSRILFRPQNCERSECMTVGIDSIVLPEGQTIYDGEFVLEYQESGWLRTITFKVPSQAPKPSSNSTQA
jgi:hypothetical protein